MACNAVIVMMLCQLFVPATMEGLPVPVQHTIVSRYDSKAQATLFQGDRLEFLRQVPDGAARLVVTSPPYNIGKKYEKRLTFEHYLEQQEDTIKEAHRALADNGSLCWQVGNHVSTDGEIFPIDIFIYQICKKLGMRVRI
jgi:adenine-specific DNA-methyltransferase